MPECKAFEFMAKEYGPYLYLRVIRGPMCIKLVDHPASNKKVGYNSDRRHSGRTGSQLLNVGDGQTLNYGGRNQGEDKGCWWSREW